MPSVEELELHRRYWQRSILIPLWTQQFLLQLVGCIIFWFAITIYWGGGPKHGAGGSGSRKEQAILGAFFILYLTLLLCTMGEILLYCSNCLKPKGYLISQVVKFTSSCGVWATLVLYPLVIKDPIASRLQVAIGMEAVFAWLQIPMLSSLVHAGLVWREERVIISEMTEDGASYLSQTEYIESPREVSQTSERTPLLAPAPLSSNSNKRVRRFGGGSRA